MHIFPLKALLEKVKLPCLALPGAEGQLDWLVTVPTVPTWMS